MVITFYAECDDCAFDMGSEPSGPGVNGATMAAELARHHQETGHQGYGILIRQAPARMAAAPADAAPGRLPR